MLFRRILLALVVATTWVTAAHYLGNRSEAFWMLFPLWILVGVFILRAIPAPRAQHKSRLAKWSVLVVVILIPIGYCFAMAQFMSATVTWKEVLIAIWFFAASLEILLLYLFQIFDSLRLRLSQGKSKARGIAILVGTKLILYGLLVPFLLCTLSLHRVKFKSQAPPPELGMTFEDVHFTARGNPQMNLSGWFFPLKNNHGTVLACHGVGANRADILEIVWILQNAGFQVLCFDFRGHGESDGHTVTYGLNERQDVLGAWDYLTSRHDVDPKKIHGFGVSMGASILLMALPELPDMNAVVADSAFSSLDYMAHHQFRFIPKPLTEIPVAISQIMVWLDSGLRMDQSNPTTAIMGLKKPIFFIHGLDDSAIPPECSRILYNSYSGPKKIHLQPGAGHGKTANLNTDQYQREVTEFFLGQHN